MKKIKNLKASLQQTAKKDIENKDSYGGFQADRYIDRTLKEGVSFWRPKDGKNAINIIPFIHGTDLFKHAGKAKGDPDIMLDIFIHKYFNQRGDQCVCLKNTFGEKCRICEERALLTEENEKKYAKEIGDYKPRHRSVMNVINQNDDENDDHNGQVQLFDETHYFFTKELLDEVNETPDDHGDPVDYYTPDEGHTVTFRAVKDKQFKCFNYKSFGFVERDEAYPDEIIDYDFSDDDLDIEHGAFPLDAMLKVHTYEEQEAMLLDADPAEADEDEEEYEEEEEKEEKPKKSSKKKAPKKPEDEEEEEADEEEEEDDSSDDCPYGKTYGKDGDAKDADCKKCRAKNKKFATACIIESMD